MNLKIDLVGCEYKIFVTMLNIENGTKNYSMLLGKALVETCKGKS
jgi:hypothetical protein